jgi:Zn-dependent peptidase ImmA (M78 family)
MPRNDVLANAPANASLERVIALKSRWGVSAMALAYRLNRLGVMTEWTYHTVCRQLSSRGFHGSEPI